MSSAVVLGSGMAGLITARVLSDHFDAVTVIEKDPDQHGPGFRPGIPQGRHFHALIPGGLEIMESFLPGLKADLRAAGSLLPEPTQFYFYGPMGKSYAQGVHQPNPPDPEFHEPAYVQTRGLLEYAVRRRVLEQENLNIRYDTQVKEPVVMDGRVAGVVTDEGEEIHADLVIDAMGKTGRTMNWLGKLGYEKPVEDTINCDFAYTSIFLKPNNPDAFTDVGFFASTDPEKDGLARGSALVRMEDGSWLALVGGRYGDYPPRDFAGFLEYAKTIPEQSFYELVSDGEPIGDPAHFRFPNGVRRRFDQLTAFPEGLIAIGDSVCHFNPAYGQGMSSACRQAQALDHVFRHRNGQSRDGLWQDVFAALYQETRAPWLFAAQADFMHPRCTGDFPEEEKPILAAMAKLREFAGQGNREALELLVKVQTLKLPLSAIESTPLLQTAAGN